MKRIALVCCVCAASLAACGGGGGDNNPPAPPFVPPPVPAPVAALVKVSARTPFTDNCDGLPPSGTLFRDAEVEPYVAVNPSSPLNIVAVWQQDRWSSGGAHALRTGYSFDGGQTWNYSAAAFSTCSGGTFPRASDPWITFTPTGRAFQIALSFAGDVQQAGSSSAVLVSRSLDGGITWDAPVALIISGSSVFNDKEAITADPNDLTGNLVYAIWDQLDENTHGFTLFSRTTDGGNTWSAPAAIYDPDTTNPKTSQTIGNQIVVLPGGDVLAFFTQIDGIGTSNSRASFRMLRSTDHGATWPAASTAISVIPQELAVGARDPETGAMIRDAASLPAVAVGAAGDLYVVFQDARFSSGQRDGILLTASHDSGLTWSAPVLVNGESRVQAFVPSVAVRRSDGLIGVTYYDQRHNTPSNATLPTDYWLALSANGTSWTDNFLTGPFDMDLAPNANGLFVGDYQSLTLINDAFVPVFAKTNTDATGPTDIYTASFQPAAVMVKAASQLRPVLAAEPEVSNEFRRRVNENLRQLINEERQPRGRGARRRRAR